MAIGTLDTELVSGNELDERIAREVMKWPVFDAEPDENTPFPHFVTYKGKILKAFPVTLPLRDGREYRHWSPSTDIRAAMEVLDFLEAEFYNVESLIIFKNDNLGGHQERKFYCRIGNYNAYAPTRELAICVAALKFIVDAAPVAVDVSLTIEGTEDARSKAN